MGVSSSIFISCFLSCVWSGVYFGNRSQKVSFAYVRKLTPVFMSILGTKFRSSTFHICFLCSCLLYSLKIHRDYIVMILSISYCLYISFSKTCKILIELREIHINGWKLILSLSFCLHLTLSGTCWAFQRTVMLGSCLYTHHNISNSVGSWSLSLS